MRHHIAGMLSFLMSVAVGTLVGQAATAPIVWAPPVPMQGSLVVLAIRAAGDDSVVAVWGELAGEPLHFEPVGWAGEFRAIGAVPLGAAARVAARVEIRHASGAVDTLAPSLPVGPRRTRRERLRADPDFVQPPESLAPRIRAERDLVRRLKTQSHDSPRLWSQRFVAPRPGAVTSVFGTARVFNGTVRSRHLGVDYAGQTGATVRAANRGVVAYAGELYFSGTTVFLDHGGGLVTAYLHLSRTAVSRGDTVAPGQLVGEVGASGRVTGPHLHWLASYGNVFVDPLDLLTIDLAAPVLPVQGAAPRGHR